MAVRWQHTQRCVWGCLADLVTPATCRQPPPICPPTAQGDHGAATGHRVARRTDLPGARLLALSFLHLSAVEQPSVCGASGLPCANTFPLLALGAAGNGRAGLQPCLLVQAVPALARQPRCGLCLASARALPGTPVFLPGVCTPASSTCITQVGEGPRFRAKPTIERLPRHLWGRPAVPVGHAAAVPPPPAASYTNTEQTSIVSLYAYGLAAKTAIAAAVAHLVEGKMRIMTVSA